MFPHTLHSALASVGIGLAWLLAQGRTCSVYGRHVKQVQYVEPGEDLSISYVGVFGYIGVNS
jgi:hypothetical protein